ncbi:MAG: type II toxin-antitoxin system RelE/ParE family toxin [Gammaproteobacteria bacterium]|nr:type II toxin-antitoxin system RelE/ParE family toxin [Gammaproteobacteria bacterium]
MTWTIKVSKTAQKQIKSLDKSSQRRLIEFLRTRINPSNPRQTGKPLKGKKKDLWRYRIGDYRIICDLQDEEITILVLAIGHRSKVYQ